MFYLCRQQVTEEKNGLLNKSNMAETYVWVVEETLTVTQR